MRAVNILCLAVWLGFISLCAAVETNVILKPFLGESPAFSFKTWQMPDGLPSDRVRSVIQTSDGYLWVATFNGLARFDGVNFKVFRYADTTQLRNSLINTLFEDSAKRLWIGNDTGEITVMDSTGFHAIDAPDDWPVAPVISFSELPNGAILVLNRNGSIIVIRDGAVVQTGGNLQGTLYSEMVTDHAGTIWAVRRGGMVVKLADGRESQDKDHPPNGGKGYRNLAAARHGGVWVRTGNQIKRWDNGRWVEDRGVQPWDTSGSVTMLETRNGDLLVGTFGEGLFVVHADGTSLHLDYGSGLPGNWVTSLEEDRENNIWVGTGSGLTRMSLAVLTMLKPTDRWERRAVESACPDQQGGLWIGTEGAGLYHYQDGQFEHFFDASSDNGSQRIRSVMEDRQGRIWLGTQSGLRWLQSGRFVPVSATVRIPRLVYALLESRDGTVWAGTQNGVVRYHEGAWSSLATELHQPDVRCIVEDASGGIWLGMRGGGVARYADGKFTQFLKAQGLPSDYVWSMFADPDGSVWIGTCGGGLVRWRKGTFSEFTSQQGLPNDFICGIQGDDKGNLWIASYSGIFRVAKSDFDQCARGKLTRISTYLLGAGDGLASLEMSGGNHPSCAQLPDGRLFFPTSGGLAEVNPNRIRFNPVPPPVRIEAVKMDQVPAVIEKDSANGNGKTTCRVMIPPGVSQLEFDYTALSFSSPERVLFKIRMTGMDQKWIEVGTRRTAYYTHLAPGEYEFQVLACNNYGVWSPDGAAMRIVVQPFFWQTWWFAPACWLGGFIFVGTGVIGGLRRRHHQKIVVLEQSRMVERERRRIAQDLHDDLGSGLTEIDSTSTLAHATAGGGEEAQEYFREISNRSKELIISMDEIVWAVNPKNDNLTSLTSYFCHYTDQFLRATPMTCRFEVPDTVPSLPLNAEQRHSLFLAFKEALNNAVRHSGGTEVCISFMVSDLELRIIIADNGHGRICEAAPGADGLSGMRTRLQHLGGKCELATAPEGGTRVLFTLPIRQTGRP